MVSETCSRTIVAPLDRVKIIMQTNTSNNNSLSINFKNVIKQEGIKNLWKGNMLNCYRILPYSALQFGTYDYCKLTFYNNRQLEVYERLNCGIISGFVATSVTHPIDVIRHRIMLDNSVKNINQSIRNLLNEQGYRSLFKGYGSTVFGLTPFIAINFCTFDAMKDHLQWSSVPGVLSMGSLSALFSQSICYPLDTIRRRMQLNGKPYKNGLDVFLKIIKNEGVKKLYSGILANAIKIMPNNAIRFLVYDCTKQYFDKNNFS